jgi:hypothetical protein
MTVQPYAIIRDEPIAIETPPYLAPIRQFARTSTNELMATKFAPLKAIVDGYLYEGFSVLAGRQKLGKTWLAIDWSVSVAAGGCAMGSIPCDAGDVLYIDLENGPRRIQFRIAALFPDERARPDLNRLQWMTSAPEVNAGLIGKLDEWRQSVADPKLVVIDVLQRIKPAGNGARNAYENDYSIWAPLQEWATRNRIAVLGLHHTRKGGADDPLESLSGSNGLSACADTTIVLDSNQNGKTLYVRGRDVIERETAITWVGNQWTILGEAADVRRTGERAVIVEALRDNREPMTPSELAIVLAKPANNIKQLLFKMAKMVPAEVYRVGNGRYSLEPLPPDNPDNRDNRAERDDE